MRLVIIVTRAAMSKIEEPDNTYLWISEKPAWEVLKKWYQVSPDFAHCSFREACDFPAHPDTLKFNNWASKQQCYFSDLFPTIKKEEIYPLDLSVSCTWIGNDSEFNDLDLFQFKINALQ